MPRMRCFPYLLLLLALALTGCGKEEARVNQELGQANLRWSTFPVEIKVDNFLLSDAQATADLNDAISFWEQKAGKPLFTIAGSWDNSDAPFTGPIDNPEKLLGNIIFFQGPWPFDSRIAGKTIVHSANGVIENSVIFLNAETNLCSHNCSGASNLVSRRKLLAHELGHFLGFGHTDSTDNVMYPEILSGGSLVGLTVDESILQTATK